MGSKTIRRRVRRNHGQVIPRQLGNLRYPASDLAVLAALAVILLGVLIYVYQLPSTTLAFAMDQPAPQAVLRNFYGLERNGTMAYRWSKPSASISVPVGAPATFLIALTLQDSPLAPQRPVTIYVNGVAMATVTPDAVAREYTVRYRYPPERWVTTDKPTLEIQLQTVPFTPVGDPRPLGIIVARVGVTADRLLDPRQPRLLLPYLIALLLTYLALRALRFPLIWVAGTLGVVLVAAAMLAVAARPFALVLTYRAISEPLWLLGVLLFTLPVPFLARQLAWRSAAWGMQSPWPDTGTLWSRRSLLLLPIAVLALGLRLYHVTYLSLWLDEAFTVQFSRLPWPIVLGLHGRYDLKPPLYFAMVKAVAAIVPEAIAGRLLSVVTGALTVVVLYALVARLLTRRAAALAALILALSPLHVWYSQEARMYAPSMLLVSLSYLALVALYRGETRWWAIVHGTAVVLALYTDYSAAYALAPQVFLFVLLIQRDRRRALAALSATALAFLGFLPWVAQVYAAATSTKNGLAWYLGVSPGKIAASLLAIVGLSGDSSYYWGGAITPWVHWPVLHPLFLLVAVACAATGLGAFLRWRSPADVVAIGLLAGTIGTATLVSLVSPGYADRTVIYAILGWAILVSAAPFITAPRWLRTAATATVVLLLLLSALSLGALYTSAQKQDYRGLARAAIRAADLGYPIVADDQLTADMIDIYRVGPLPSQLILANDLATRAADRQALPVAFWYVYGDYPWTTPRHFESDGYERRSHQSFGDGLYLDFYARPDVPPIVPAIWLAILTEEVPSSVAATVRVSSPIVIDSVCDDRAGTW